MWEYQENTHEDFTRGQAVTLMADGKPIGSKMIVRGAGEEHGSGWVGCAWHDSEGRAQESIYPPNALCSLDELASYEEKLAGTERDELEQLKLEIGEACKLLGPGRDGTLKSRIESKLTELLHLKESLEQLQILFQQLGGSKGCERCGRDEEIEIHRKIRELLLGALQRKIRAAR